MKQTIIKSLVLLVSIALTVKAYLSIQFTFHGQGLGQPQIVRTVVTALAFFLTWGVLRTVVDVAVRRLRTRR